MILINIMETLLCPKIFLYNKIYQNLILLKKKKKLE